MSDDDLIPMVLDEARDKMAKALSHAREEFTTIRTGRAAPALVERMPVDYYGTEVPLQQIAGFTVPEARMLVISPYDKSSLGAIEKAIQQSGLGLSPSNDGQIIRLNFPPLTEERRKRSPRRTHDPVCETFATTWGLRACRMGEVENGIGRHKAGRDERNRV